MPSTECERCAEMVISSPHRCLADTEIYRRVADERDRYKRQRDLALEKLGEVASSMLEFHIPRCGECGLCQFMKQNIDSMTLRELKR